MPLEATQNPRSTADASRRAGRVGRRVGVALFWLLAAYVVGGAALSIIPSLYGAETTSARRARVDVCAREIRELERTLADAKSRCADEGPRQEHRR